MVVGSLKKANFKCTALFLYRLQYFCILAVHLNRLLFAEGVQSGFSKPKKIPSDVSAERLNKQFQRCEKWVKLFLHDSAESEMRSEFGGATVEVNLSTSAALSLASTFNSFITTTQVTMAMWGPQWRT